MLLIIIFSLSFPPFIFFKRRWQLLSGVFDLGGQLGRDGVNEGFDLEIGTEPGFVFFLGRGAVAPFPVFFTVIGFFLLIHFPGALETGFRRFFSIQSKGLEEISAKITTRVFYFYFSIHSQR